MYINSRKESHNGIILNAKIGGNSKSRYNWLCTSHRDAVFHIIQYISIIMAKLNVFHIRAEEP